MGLSITSSRVSYLTWQINQLKFYEANYHITIIASIPIIVSTAFQSKPVPLIVVLRSIKMSKS